MLFLEISDKDFDVLKERPRIVTRPLVDIVQWKPSNVSDLELCFRFEHSRLWQTLGSFPIWNDIQANKLVVYHLGKQTLHWSTNEQYHTILWFV